MYEYEEISKEQTPRLIVMKPAQYPHVDNGSKFNVTENRTVMTKKGNAALIEITIK